MISPLVLERFNELCHGTTTSGLNAARQVFQEILLFGLSRADFFKYAVFEGGTCLRIVYGSRRFSEDLDFRLIVPDKTFDLSKYHSALTSECAAFGLDIEIREKRSIGAVKRIFTVESALPAELNLQKGEKLRVKLEIDTNPPLGKESELKMLPFPSDHYILIDDRPSLFAGKLHALLCREYDKGRDWFDFLYYSSRNIAPNLQALRQALLQAGPYKEDPPQKCNLSWLKSELEKKVESLNIDLLKKDVRPFLIDSRDGDIWSKEYLKERIRGLCK